MLVVIGTDCIGGCNSNYHTIMTTTEIPKHAGPMDKSGKNQFGPEKHWFTPDRLWYKILGLLMKFVSDLWHVDSFLWVLMFPPPIKLKYC
jgi:hypothetical protein